MPTPIHTRRSVPLTPAEVPGRLPGGDAERLIEVPAALRAFVVGPLKVVSHREWNGERASVRISIQGQPVSVTGELVVTADGANSLVTFDGDVTANVPFVASMVEAAVRDEVQAQVERELATLSD